MGTDRAHGVIDEYGEVHGHRGLSVVDGAAVPSATGVNPSASVLAMAERTVERAIRSMLGDERWKAPEMADVTPADVPEDQAMLLMSIQRRQRSGNGVRFSEAMTGSLRVSGVSRAARLTLNAHIAGWRNSIHEPNHPVSLSGTVDIEGLPQAVLLPGHSSSFLIPVMSPCDTGCRPNKTVAKLSCSLAPNTNIGIRSGSGQTSPLCMSRRPTPSESSASHHREG